MGKDNNRRGSKKASGRDSGGFVALPWSVLDSLAYRTLSHTARSLLIEFARQYVRDNNGRLLASLRHLKTRGWKSADVISRAKQELLEGGFIFLTVQGYRPNKANWYAITWQDLDPNPKYDPGTMERWKDHRSGYLKHGSKITALSPSHGLDKEMIGPSSGTRLSSSSPSNGSISTYLILPTSPYDGNHLETPSNVVLSHLHQCLLVSNNSTRTVIGK